MGNVVRRLERLEAFSPAVGGGDLAALVQEGRRRVHMLSPGALREEERQRLQEMQQRHAMKPLLGLELRMMEGLARVCAACPSAAGEAVQVAT